MAEAVVDRTADVLREAGIKPAESLGQNFLVDQATLELIAEQVNTGSTLIEVGVGTGTLTELIAPRAVSLVGIEIDRRFAPFLSKLEEAHPNTRFLLQDALTINLGDYVESDNTQVFANLPFHITEPFLLRLIDLPITNAILILGDHAAEELIAPPESSFYGRMSLLAQTFFSVTPLKDIPRESFYPVPGTDAALIVLTPRNAEEVRADRSAGIFAKIFRDSTRHRPVINSIKDGLIQLHTVDKGKSAGKRAFHKRERASVRRALKEQVRRYNETGEFQTDTRRQRGIFSQEQALATIRQMGIPDDVLRLPFSTLNNSQLRDIVRGIQSVMQRE